MKINQLLRIALLVGWAPIAIAADLPEEHSGYLEPGQSIKVSSGEPGIVQEVYVSEGQEVDAGDILVRLDTRVLDWELKIAAEEYRMLKLRLEKLQELIGDRFASEDELLRAASDLKITELKQERTRAQIERLTLRAPISGVVTELRYNVAEGISGANSHVATVVQLEPMRVQFNLPVSDAQLLSNDDPVEIFFPAFDESRYGSVEYISPVTAAVVNTMRVRVLVPDAGLIPAGAKGYLVFPVTQPLTSNTKKNE